MTTRRNPKGQSRQKLSPTQKTTLHRMIGLLLLVALLWLVFAPGFGLVSLLRQKSELEALRLRTQELASENAELKKVIDKLQYDEAYLEEVARREYGLLKEHERVYDFSKPKQPKKK